MLVDTHCHLYGKQFDADLPQVIERASRNGVGQIFLPAIDSETHDKLLHLSGNHQPSGAQAPQPEVLLYPMMGVHPCSINAEFEKELEIARKHLNSGRKFYAVGEIGLDYHWDLTFKLQQLTAFEEQIGWAVELHLPIVIHSRKSNADCISCVSKYAGKVGGIFHCFSGTIDEANEIIALGFMLGIGGVATYKNGGLVEILQAIRLENIVLETDAPYLAPEPYRGKRNEPSYIKTICEAVASATRNSPEEVAKVTTQNALKVFKLN